MKFLTSRFSKVNQPIEILNQKQYHALKKFEEKIANGDYQFEEVSCLCGNNKDKAILISPIDRYGLSVPTYLCQNCALMWTAKRLDRLGLEKFYQEDYRAIYVGESQAPKSFFDNQVERGKQIYEFVKPHLDLSNGVNPTIFEIGCGSGGILMPFKVANCSVFGCDLGSEYLEKGREMGLVLEQGESDVMGQYGKADLIILNHVLEHFPDPYSSISQISKLLKENGYIYIAVPGIFAIHRTYGDILLFLQNAHLYHFTLANLVALMKIFDFSLVKGNESISALFQKNSHSQQKIKPESFNKILIYLYFLEIERRFHLWELSQKLRFKAMQKVRNIFSDELVDTLKVKLSGRKK